MISPPELDRGRHLLHTSTFKASKNSMRQPRDVSTYDINASHRVTRHSIRSQTRTRVDVDARPRYSLLASAARHTPPISPNPTLRPGYRVLIPPAHHLPSSHPPYHPTTSFHLHLHLLRYTRITALRLRPRLRSPHPGARTTTPRHPSLLLLLLLLLLRTPAYAGVLDTTCVRPYPQSSYPRTRSRHTAHPYSYSYS